MSAVTNLRIKVANWVMPERRSCGCAQKPFPMYSMDCPKCNPRYGWTAAEVDREFRKTQAEFHKLVKGTDYKDWSKYYRRGADEKDAS